VNKRSLSDFQGQWTTTGVVSVVVVRPVGAVDGGKSGKEMVR
jgi:hypothetical protein